MILYHVTTAKKAKAYRESQAIHSPVRGFTTFVAALAWGCKVGRTVVLEFDANAPHKLPDHHNEYGQAFWNEGNVNEWKCVFSAEKDA